MSQHSPHFSLVKITHFKTRIASVNHGRLPQPMMRDVLGREEVLHIAVPHGVEDVFLQIIQLKRG